MVIFSQERGQIVNSNMTQRFWIVEDPNNSTDWYLGCDIIGFQNNGCKLGTYPDEETAAKELDRLFYALTSNEDTFFVS